MKYVYTVLTVPKAATREAVEHAFDDLPTLDYHVVQMWEYGVLRYFLMEAVADE